MGTQYATLTDLTRLGLASGALGRVPWDTQTGQLAYASAYADGFLRSRYALPLTVWGDDLREAVCAIAAEGALTTIGFNPEDPANAALVARANRARAWLKMVGTGQIDPAITDSTHDVQEGTGFVSTLPRRGWRRR